MKIYRDETNDLILSVTDEGYGYPVATFLAEMGMSFGAHETVIKRAVSDFLEGDKSIHLLDNSHLLEPLTADDDHPYVGMTLDEVIAKFCGEPEEL